MKKKLMLKEEQFAENGASSSSFDVKNGEKTQKKKKNILSLESLSRKILKKLLKEEKRQGKLLRKQEKVQKKSKKAKNCMVNA